ncbi:sporulation related protein [Hasllibacter halocynthiae]|uniref:Sporulation related protein n=1 Tax=Hasllibacter halocynthiae TaxID=595589 RepID=A0A2T0X7H8_9RHOB|nr:SPOR domain-containing protein [Hasllibacter halocynthiae]PRY94886.1 sporulation related protein [Hasllibacter halocynthiae]
MTDIERTGMAGGPDIRMALAAVTQRTVQWVGAGASLALVAGGLWWGWQTLSREASGVPVIQALADPMRERPADPGGRVIPHQGLSVNAVAGGDGVRPGADRVILAPGPEAPREEDVILAVLREEAPAPVPVAVTSPIEDAITAALNADAEVLPASVPGVTLSLRPRVRPGALARRAPVPDAPEIAPEALTAGALLAQIGTFPDEDTARAEWTRLASAHPAHLSGRERVIQRRETGGRSWVRLRAAGFGGRPEAVRFCDAMLAGGVECVPVEHR